ncbi:hypothetical protein F511_46459 [Dorcoceras hygrometricum]|uniref:Uncharacterized protein n=1 Tax=Dorcoceras hygrometricum TaxID=472368 RepID=A0A2Z6ZTF3_9LAMI|nr:hypothetical protein F511_46459 [Dorcoceras hygrometricum]
MRHVCTIQLEVDQVVELTLDLLEYQYDLSRSYLAQFLCSAFVYRAILGAFDRLHDLQKLLSLLRDFGLAIYGGATTGLNNPRSLSNPGSLSESKKIATFYTYKALECYFKAQRVGPASGFGVFLR